MKAFSKVFSATSLSLLAMAQTGNASQPGTIQYLERGELAHLRLVMQDGGELKCLTDVSDQAFSSRDVTWNRCAADSTKPDFVAQQWIMKDVNTDGSVLLNNLMVFRPVNGQFRVLSIGGKFENGNKATLELIAADTIELVEGPATRFAAFDFLGEVDGKLTAVLSLFQIQTDAVSEWQFYCVGKPEANFSQKGAVAVKFSADASDEFNTVYPNCADITSFSNFK